MTVHLLGQNRWAAISAKFLPGEWWKRMEKGGNRRLNSNGVNRVISLGKIEKKWTLSGEEISTYGHLPYS